MNICVLALVGSFEAVGVSHMQIITRGNINSHAV